MIVLQLLLWVIAGILGLILILLMLIAAADFAVRVRYEKDELSVAIGIWPVMIQVWPFDSQKANQKPPAKKSCVSEEQPLKRRPKKQTNSFVNNQLIWPVSLKRLKISLSPVSHLQRKYSAV